MTTTGAVQPPSAPKPLLERVVGVLTAPGDTFRNVAAHPRWLGVLLLTTLVAAGLWFWFLTTESGQMAMLDQQVRQIEAWGGTVSDEQYAGIERSLPLMRYIVPVTTLVMGPLVTLILAGVLFGVFNAGLGGDATFKQMFSVVVHAGIVILLQTLFIMPLNYVRESTTSATNLAVFLPMLDEGSLAARFLGMMDLFVVWWLIVLGIGLAVLYRRRTQPIVVGLLIVYLVIAAGIALVMRGVAGSA
jgi:hypothetical protein